MEGGEGRWALSSKKYIQWNQEEENEEEDTEGKGGRLYKEKITGIKRGRRGR